MNKQQLSVVERFNLFYPKILSGLVNISDVALTLIRTVLVTFALPVVLVFILVVEQNRLSHGIAVFEPNNSLLVAMASSVLVILNAVLEFLIVYEEDKSGYKREVSYRPSLRIVGIRLLYLSGWTEPEFKSPADRYKRALGVVTFAILFLALLGSMREEMATAQGAWYSALWGILTESSLIDFMTWISSLLFAFTLVVSAQTLSNYIAVYTTAVINNMSERTNKYELEKNERERQERARLEDEQKRGKPISVTNTTIRIRPGGKVLASCPDCGWEKEYDKESSAKAGLQSHKPYCRHTVVYEGVEVASNGHLHSNGNGNGNH